MFLYIKGKKNLFLLYLYHLFYTFIIVVLVVFAMVVLFLLRYILLGLVCFVLCSEFEFCEADKTIRFVVHIECRYLVPQNVGLKCTHQQIERKRRKRRSKNNWKIKQPTQLRMALKLMRCVCVL